MMVIHTTQPVCVYAYSRRSICRALMVRSAYSIAGLLPTPGQHTNGLGTVSRTLMCHAPRVALTQQPKGVRAVIPTQLRHFVQTCRALGSARALIPRPHDSEILLFDRRAMPLASIRPLLRPRTMLSWRVRFTTGATISLGIRFYTAQYAPLPFKTWATNLALQQDIGASLKELGNDH